VSLKTFSIMAKNGGEFAVTDPSDQEANEWTKANYLQYLLDPNFIKYEAEKDLQNEKEILKSYLDSKSHQFEIIEISPDENKTEPDIIFTADASQIVRKKTLSKNPENERDETYIIFSKFGHTIRDGEVDLHKKAILQAVRDGKVFTDKEVKELSIDLNAENLYDILKDKGRIIEAENFREGNGNSLSDPYRGVIWSANSGRAHPDSPKEIKDKTGLKTIMLELDEKFFHIDTAMYPLPSGHFVVCEKAFKTPEDYKFFLQKAFPDGHGGIDKIARERFEIKITPQEAEEKFMGNAVVMGNQVFIPYEDKAIDMKYDLKNAIEEIIYKDRPRVADLETLEEYKAVRDFKRLDDEPKTEEGNKKAKERFAGLEKALREKDEFKKYISEELKPEIFDEIYSQSLKGIDKLEGYLKEKGLNIDYKDIFEIANKVEDAHQKIIKYKEDLINEIKNEGEYKDKEAGIFKKLEKAGFKPVLVPMGASVKGGGGTHCTSAFHPQNIFVNWARVYNNVKGTFLPSSAELQDPRRLAGDQGTTKARGDMLLLSIQRVQEEKVLETHF